MNSAPSSEERRSILSEAGVSRIQRTLGLCGGIGGHSALASSPACSIECRKYLDVNDGATRLS